MEQTGQRENSNEAHTPRAELLLPKKKMSSCIYMAIMRDTRGAQLVEKDQFNMFSSSPFCSVHWFLSGKCRLVNMTKSGDLEVGGLFPKMVVSGPSDHALVSKNEGDIFGVSVGFYPDAWFALTGVPAEQITNKYVEATQVLNAELMPAFEQMLIDGTEQERFATFQKSLAPIWERKRPNSIVAPDDLHDWVNATIKRVAMTGAGRSARQMQRRMREWTGHSQQELNAYARGEALYSSFLEQRGNDDFSISQLAADVGFSDQSHLGREVRKITGMTPRQLDKLIDVEERFWFYRLLRQHFG